MHWDTFIDEGPLAALLPATHAHFALPVKECLVVFLGGLPKGVQAEILADQAALPLDAPLAQRLGRLGHQCPVLQKLGQTLARDQRLAPELRRHLCELESTPPTIALEEIDRTLTHELGPLADQGISLAPAAVAEASVAVVIPFRQVRGDRQHEGVFKLLKPKIEERLRLELDLLAKVGDHLDERCEELGLPQLDYRETFDQIREKLTNEVDLVHEQQHLREARAFYASDHRVAVPEVYDCCTARVTAMQRLRGVKVTDHGLACGKQRRRLAQLVCRTMITRPLLAGSSSSLFHGDPHAGNLFHTDDDRLGVLDWSLVGRLGDRERIAMVQILLAAITLRPEKIVAILGGLAERNTVDGAALERVVCAWVRKVRRGTLPGLSWAVGMLDDAAHSARLSVSPDMLLFRKSLLTLEGVIRDLGATDLHVDNCVAADFARQFGRELPTRCCAPLASRRFGTRISNADLTETVLSCSLLGPRFWLAETGELLNAARRFAAVTA